MERCAALLMSRPLAMAKLTDDRICAAEISNRRCVHTLVLRIELLASHNLAVSSVLGGAGTFGRRAQSSNRRRSAKPWRRERGSQGR